MLYVNLIGMGPSRMGRTRDIRLCGPVVDSGVLACRLQGITSPGVTTSNAEL